MSKTIKLHPYAEIHDEAMFLHCKICGSEEKRDDLSVYVYVEENDLSFWIVLICENHTPEFEVARYRLMKEEDK